MCLESEMYMKDRCIDEILIRIDKFCKDRNWDQFHTPKKLAIGAVTESVELLDLYVNPMSRC